ncbi:transglutaminase domain-containing protein [Aequorivita sp. Q41]|uniref:transglutaminase domain-containing protein n=1 Tax=Aequorivita sp. Q41 TaxID=3153300 RepID=UPI00324275EB
MRKQSVFLFFICAWVGSYGQIGSIIGAETAYSRPISQQTKPAFSTAKLAFTITKNAISDTDKATAIYSWIVSNIAYDHELMHSEMLQKQFYTSEENVIKKVLERKMALCGGFAFLYKQLCAEVGIAVEVIHGFTKNYSSKTQIDEKPKHTWNAVKLNNKWFLLDITWAISNGDGKNPDNFWFLTTPTDFMYSHYPKNSRWTLLKYPQSFEEFQRIGNP